MQKAYIVDAVRTPIGKFCGTLSSVRPDDLAALTLAELMRRNSSVDPAEIGDVILGCTNQAGEDNRDVARMAVLLAGLPETVPGITVNRLCASGMSAVLDAARQIKLGEGDLFIAGGVEHMTRAPLVLAKGDTAFSRNAEIYDTSIGWRFVNQKLKEKFGTEGMGETAENVAEQFNIGREDQDAFAAWSQQKAETAIKSGRLAKEIVAVSIPQRKADPINFDTDEFPRAGTTVEILAKLRPAFRHDGKGSVTAGNSSGINDGACAVLLASESALKKYNLTPLATVEESAVVGLEPRIMGVGPMYATQKLLKQTGRSMDDFDVIELNEAFAAQSLACTRGLEIEDNDVRINPNGGAIALGHPLGMSGARLIQTAVLELHEQNKHNALCTMCIGVGQGIACRIEKV
ncbi:MAG: 3-oxoadipyl-CoA thiolase [Bdellovibrionales bacterium]|nr:3-oxoadipyl-CoA thiolase [Bdellovibrionales bacterium]